MTEAAKATSGTGGEAKKEGGERLVSIGQLVRDLQSEFPDLSISKVRYLEDRGLLTPHRTKGRYRKYTKADMRALRTILAMQRDEYLPLDVIKRRMDSPEGAQPGSKPFSLAQGVGWSDALRRQNPIYTGEEFCDELGAEEEYVDTLVEFGLLDRASESGPAFTEGDLETARICQRLTHYHVEPRHLRMLSSAAEREAGLIVQVATPDLRSGHSDRREYGVQTIQELAGLFDQLMRLLLLRELGPVL